MLVSWLKATCRHRVNFALPCPLIQTIYLIRHGEGFHNIGYDHNLDAHLTPRGWAQTAVLQQHLTALQEQIGVEAGPSCSPPQRSSAHAGSCQSACLMYTYCACVCWCNKVVHCPCDNCDCPLYHVNHFLGLHWTSKDFTAHLCRASADLCLVSLALPSTMLSTHNAHGQATLVATGNNCHWV